MEYSPTTIKLLDFKFKSCLWTLWLGLWLGLQQSYSKTRKCGLYSTAARKSQMIQEIRKFNLKENPYEMVYTISAKMTLRNGYPLWDSNGST